MPKSKALTVAQIEKLVANSPKSKNNTFDKIETLLSNKNNWIKEYETNNAIDDSEQDEVGQVCLIGAINLVNGKHQDSVTQAIVLAIYRLFPNRVGNKSDSNLESFCLSDMSQDTFEDLISQIQDQEYSLDEDYIPEFNDHSETTHKDVLKVVALARTIKQGLDDRAKKLETYSAKFDKMQAAFEKQKLALAKKMQKDVGVEFC